MNPGGSVKDRIALRMVEAAEATGALKPGGTIVEPTSGNTGVGLALVAQRKGYRCVFVCPDKVGEDKRNVLKAYGAEVVVSPTAVAPDHPDSYYSVSDRLVKEIDGGWKPDQYSNPEGPQQPLRDHRPGDLGRHRRPDHALRRPASAPAAPSAAPAATSRRSPRAACASSAPTPRARSTPAAPAAPTWSRASARTSGRAPTTRAWSTRSSPSATPTRSPMTRRLAREEGLLVGGSCGMAVVAALRAAARPQRRRRRGRAAARQRPRLHGQDLQRRLDGVLRLPARGRRADRRRGPARQVRRDPRAGAHPPERDGPRRDRDPARVRRLADARRQGRAARHGGRGRRRGQRARPARGAVRREGAPGRPGREAHERLRCRWSARASRSPPPGTPWRRPTRSWWSRAASRSAC